MSRRDEYLDAPLRRLGAACHQTLHGDAAAWDVTRAVAQAAGSAPAQPLPRSR